MDKKEHSGCTLFLNEDRSKGIYVYRYNLKDEEQVYIVQYAEESDVRRLVQYVCTADEGMLADYEFVNVNFDKLPLRTFLEDKEKEIVLEAYKKLDDGEGLQSGSCYKGGNPINNDEETRDVYYHTSFDYEDAPKAYERIKEIILPDTTSIIFETRTDVFKAMEVAAELLLLTDINKNEIKVNYCFSDKIEEGTMKIYLVSVHDSYELPEKVEKWDHKDTTIFLLASDEGCVQLYCNKKAEMIPGVAAKAKKGHPYYDYLIKCAEARGYYISWDQPDLTHEILEEEDVGYILSRHLIYKTTKVMNQLKSGRVVKKEHVLFENEASYKAMLVDYAQWKDSLYVIETAEGKENVEKMKVAIKDRITESNCIYYVSNFLDEADVKDIPLRTYLEGEDRDIMLRYFDEACAYDQTEGDDWDRFNPIGLPHDWRDYYYYSCIVDVKDYEKAIDVIKKMYLPETTHLLIDIRTSITELNLFAAEMENKIDIYWGYVYKDEIPEGCIQLNFLIVHAITPRSNHIVDKPHKQTKLLILSSDEGCVEVLYNKTLLEAPVIVSKAYEDDYYYEKIKERKDLWGYRIDESHEELVHELLKHGEVGESVDEQYKDLVMKLLKVRQTSKK